MRIPIRHRGLVKRGTMSAFGFVGRAGLAVLLHCVWPVGILWAALKFTAWPVMTVMMPDVIYWLEAVAAIVFITDLLEVALLWRVYWLTHPSMILQPA